MPFDGKVHPLNALPENSISNGGGYMDLVLVIQDPFSPYFVGGTFDSIGQKRLFPANAAIRNIRSYSDPRLFSLIRFRE